MELKIDESEALHIHSCLIVGNDKFAKAKKDLEKLEMDAAEIDEQININAKLRRIFNPRAEEEARAKRDDAQLDLTEVPSSGETGGGIPAGQTFKLNTGEPKSIEELRDGLLECGVAVLVIDIDSWSEDEQRSASDYLDSVRLAMTEDNPAAAIGRIDVPECIARDATTVGRLQELLAAGPWRVAHFDESEDGPAHYAVIRDVMLGDLPHFESDSTTDDKLDAEIRAARLNLTELQRADMSDEDIREWAGKGPWRAFEELHETPDANEWIIAAGTQREVCESKLDALGRAARYNRSIAQRAGNGHSANEQEVEIVAVAGADQAD